MNILVTGATGFIGQQLIPALLSHGWRVRGLARRPDRIPADMAQTVEWVYGDLRSSPIQSEFIEGCDWIFHCAGAIRARRTRDFLLTNYLGTRRLIEALLKSPHPRPAILFLSSLAAAGPSQPHMPKTEDQPCFPVSAYGYSKLAAEALLRHHRLDFTSVILRPGIVYGPGDRETLRLFRLARHRLTFQPGFQTPFYSLIHVDDLVRMMIRCASIPVAAGEIFFAADNETGHPLREIIRLAALRPEASRLTCPVPLSMIHFTAAIASLVSQTGARPGIFNLDKYREMRCPNWVCNPSKAEAQLGFKTTVGLSAGLRQTAQWYREMRWLLTAHPSGHVSSDSDRSYSPPTI